MQTALRDWAHKFGGATPPARFGILASVVCLWLHGIAQAAPKEDWLPISPQELAETAPQLVPDAPAEILFSNLEIEDKDFPQERIRREYVRAKIYKPEHIEALTRISGHEVTDDSLFGLETKVKLQARLTLPDGTTKIFGDEAIRERVLTQTGERNFLDRLLGATGQQVKERFMAVGGAEAGSILEFKIERREHGRATPYDVFTFQRRGIAIRKIHVVAIAPNGEDWNFRYFILNPSIAHAKMEEDLKRKSVTLEAFDVPPLNEEPLAGPMSYHALSILSCYEQKERPFIARHDHTGFRIDPRKTGPWSMYSIEDYKRLEDCVEVTSRIRKLVAEVTGDAKDPAEKAKRIHDRLRTMYAHFLNESKYNKTEVRLDTFSRTLDDLLDYDRKTQVVGIGGLDYLALGMSMYKAAGLESRALLLPDSRGAPFNKKLASRLFVPHRALQVKIDGRWIYSMPMILPALPFGEIPWYCEGQVALLIKDGPEEFVPVAYSEGGKSLIGNGGTFELKSDGTLTGTGKRKYTGHAAFAIRHRLLNHDPARQRTFLARQISHDFNVLLRRSTVTEEEGSDPNDEHPRGFVKIRSITGLDTPEAPLEIEYALALPNFATVTDQRLIFRPWLFRANEVNPFTSDTRISNIYFPYARQELDVATIRLPAGFTPEFSEETSPSSGKALHYKASILFNAESRTLTLRREFASNLAAVPASVYPELKSWYDTMTRVDQQEVVATVAAASESSKPPASVTPAESPATAPAASP